MTNLTVKTLVLLIVLLLLCSSCTAITHVDEFEEIDSEIQECMDQASILNPSDECAYCRCTNCDVEIEACGLRCREILECAIRNRCERDNLSSCVAEKCRTVLDRAQAGIDQASTLWVCISKCNDVCLEQ